MRVDPGRKKMAAERRAGDSNVLNNSKLSKSFSVRSECRTFSNFDVFCVFFSIGTFIADLTTDCILVVEYWIKGHLYWSLGTLALIVVPAILIQLFSMRWHLMDEAVSIWHWITHVCLIGLLHRYTIMLRTAFEARESKSPHDFQRLYLQQSDICMLHLFESFLEAAPQLILQLYIMVVVRDWHFFTGISAAVSLCSLSWAVVSYVRALRRARTDKARARGPALALQAAWRGPLLAARLTALLLFAVGFRHWIFVLLGAHWLMMTIWVIQQKTDFCSSRSEEIFYNCIVGVIYCFCFFNLREGQARYRMIAFYIIMVTQNIACLLLFLFLSEPGSMKHEFVITAFGIIVGGTLIGLASMLVYYRWFHPAGPIMWVSDRKEPSKTEESIESNIPHKEADTDPVHVANQTMRSLKRPFHETPEYSAKSEEVSAENSPQLETECTDKKLLLEHWIARAGSPTFASAPIDKTESADVTGVEFYSVANTPEKNNRSHLDKTNIACASFQIDSETKNRISDAPAENISNSFNKSKRRGICSPTELGLKFSKLEQNEDCLEEMSEINDTLDLSAQKRRGICSSGQLEEEIHQLEGNDRNNDDGNLQSVSDGSSERDRPNCSKQKTSSDSINLDMDLSFSDINSSDINEFNENIVQKLCLSTLKNIKNVHQDADICNIQKIALEILKDLYSKGEVKDDQDLESELSSSIGRDLETPSEVLSAHDYENICAVNIAREAWGLRSWRACADMGASPPPPPPLPARRPAPPPPPHHCHPPHHYLHTVAYELSKCEDNNCHILKSSEYHKESESALFVAKPYVVDQNGGIYPIPTPLEPILEELDEVIENNGTIRRRQRHSSESALVATIDEIRNDAVTNSPRNVYHRADWDSPRLSVPKDKLYDKQSQVTIPNLRKGLWKEQPVQSQDLPEKIDSSSESKSSSSDNTFINVPYKGGRPVTIDVCERVTLDEGKINKVPCVKYKNNCDLGNRHFKNVDIKQKIDRNNGKKSRNFSKVQYQKKESVKISPKAKIDDTLARLPVTQQHNLSYEEVVFLSQLVVDSDSYSIKNKPNINSTEDLSNFGISSSLQSLIDKDQQNCTTIPKTSVDSRPSGKRSSNRPRRKFSLLREKFEPKSKHSDEEMLFQSLESIRSLSHNDLDITSSRKMNENVVLVNQAPKIINNKENLTPSTCLVERVLPESSSSEAVVLSLAPCDISHNDSYSNNLREKRSLFLKQVLSPPKINSWNKKT